MTKYTVLLLRPSWQHDGPESDWIFRAHVEAGNVEQAEEKALTELMKFGDGMPAELRDECATIAVYEGHLFDLFQP